MNRGECDPPTNKGGDDMKKLAEVTSELAVWRMYSTSNGITAIEREPIEGKIKGRTKWDRTQFTMTDEVFAEIVKQYIRSQASV